MSLNFVRPVLLSLWRDLCTHILVRYTLPLASFSHFCLGSKRLESFDYCKTALLLEIRRFELVVVSSEAAQPLQKRRER